jgi:hypothetical protein
MALTSSGMTLYDPTDQNDPMAVYSNGGIQLGKQGSSTSGKYNLAIDPSNGISFRQYTTELFNIGLLAGSSTPALQSSGAFTLWSSRNITLNGYGTAVEIGQSTNGKMMNVDGRIYAQYYIGSSSATREVLTKGHVQIGTTSQVSVSAQSVQTVDVGFPSSFATVPKVVCGLVSTSGDYQIGRVSVAVVSVTQGGFKARVFNADSSGRGPAISWIAMEE